MIKFKFKSKTNAFYYLFCVGFFLIGGGVILYGFLTTGNTSLGIISIMSIGIGLFLIWLDRRYDLD